MATFSYYLKTSSFANFAHPIFASQFDSCQKKKRLVMISVGWVFDFVSNWLFKSFRIKERPVLGFFWGEKTIKEPHGS